MSKIDIAASIRNFLGLAPNATDAEVHQTMQEQTDAETTATSTPPATKEMVVEKAKTAQAATPEASSQEPSTAELITQLIQASMKDIKADLADLKSRINAIEAQPSTDHTEGEQKTEDNGSQPSWMSDPVNIRAMRFVNRKRTNN